MGLAAHSLVLSHPLWHLACKTLAYFNVEDHLGPSAHFALCGEWSGVASAAGALVAAARDFNATSEQARRLELCAGDGSWYDAPSSASIPFVCETYEQCDGATTLQYEAGLCYEYVEEPQTYYSAESICRQRGGALVKIDSAAKNRAVNEVARGGAAWIGLAEPNTCADSWDAACEMWYWRDETSVTYSNWDRGEPNNYGGVDEDAAFMNYCDKDHEGGDLEAIVLIMILAVLVFALLAIAIEGFIVCLYRGNVRSVRAATAVQLQPAALQNSPYSMQHSNNDFRFGVCECFQACETCLHAAFFLVARVGDTQDALLSSGVWTLFLCWSIGFFIGAVIDSLSWSTTMQDSQLRNHLSNLLVALYSFSKRQELRRRFGGDPGPFCCTDFWCWWCCTLCVATQEARLVDSAAGLRQSCCCKLVPQMMPPPGVVQMGAVQMGGPTPVAMGTPVGAPVAVGTVVAQPVAVGAAPVQATATAVAVTPEPTKEA